MFKKILAIMMTLCLAGLVMTGCGSGGTDKTEETTAADGTAKATTATTNLSKLDMTKWQYNADDDVYYQIGIVYCETPANEDYEQLAVFVPGAYMTATDNGDGTYTCELNADAEVNGYTASTAPIVMPINTPGYSAQSALTEYKSVTDYTSQGFVYVHAGCRGRDDGAPAGVTDLKAAIRYIRYCDDVIAGDAESIFVFGMSGGGAQAAIVGATGDSELYDPYLEAIGAVQGVSDAVVGSMDWCPITNLDTADEAYEWMMGSTRSGLTDDEQAISDALATAFAEYINSAGFTDAEGNTLTLTESSDGIYQSGAYYEYIKSVIEQSLNNFLSDTEFPYDASSSSKGGGMGGAPSGGTPSGDKPDGNMPSGEKPDGAPSGSKPDGDTGEEATSIEDVDDITRNDTSSSGVSTSGTYETAQDYIDALNTNGEWITYDETTNTVTITSIEDFVSACKNASKNLGAFDQLDAGQGENTLFGYGDGSGAHFDSTLADILTELGSSYASDYTTDLSKTDSVGYTAQQRVNMYTPLYYLLESQEGYGTSTVSKYWRIRTGINQGDTSLTTEVNLALALENYDGVESVDFETVWGQGHTEAERTGDSTSNFIEWVNSCMK
ncbi:MAG: tannase [Ruminococcus sp.]|nr:tannase [Ruminococcus sp.]